MVEFHAVKDVSSEEYFNNDEFAYQTFNNKYCHFKEDGSLETPAEVFYRVAKGLDFDGGYADEWFSLMYDGWFRPGGSILYGVGAKVKSSLLNCTTIPLQGDSLEDISKCDYDVMKCAAFRQGIGIDFSNLRPRGSFINNAAQYSTGAVPWMEKIVDNGKYVGQLGRMPALLTSLKDKHPDIFEFVTAKKEQGRIENANISVQISDKFMEAVDNDDEWELKFEFDGKYDPIVKKVQAKDLFDLIAQTAFESAEPGVQFIDAFRDASMVHQIYRATKDCRFKVVSTNACLPDFATVLTPEGIREFKDIDIGSTIWSGKQWTQVINKWYTGVKPVYKYITSAGEFVGTDDHKVIVQGEREEIRESSCIDVSWNDSSEKSYNFDPQTVMDGLVIGDGSIHNNLIYLNVGDNDYDYFNSEVRDLFIRERPAINDYAWEVYTTIKREELPYTYERSVPERVFTGNEQIVASFLRGLFSANGFVVGKRAGLKQTSFTLIKQVQQMLSSIGVRSYVTYNKSKYQEFRNGIYETKPSYDLNIYVDGDIFLNKIGFLQGYKQNSLNQIVLDKKFKGNSKKSYDITYVVYLGDYDVYDITVEAPEHTFWTGGCLVSNCSEKPLPPYSTCNLFSINMEKFSTDPEDYKKEMDYVVPLMVRMADSVVTYELENDLSPIEEQRWILEQTREIGCGITNLHGWFLKQHLPYDSDEAIDKAEEFKKQYSYRVFDSSAKLGEEKGNAPAYDLVKDKSCFINSTYFKNIVDFFYNGDPNIPFMRNLAHMSIAPTGTLSFTFSPPCLSQGVEPLIAPFFWRKKRTQDRMGYDYYFVIPERVQGYLLSLLDETSEEYQKLKEFEGSVLDNDGTIGKEYVSLIQSIVSPEFLKPAHKIDIDQKVKLISRLYDWMDASISCTYNLPKSATVEDVKNVYKKTFHYGGRAASVYVEGSREGIILTEFPEKKDPKICEESRPVDIAYNCAPKRPDKLPCNIHQISIKGEKWVVLVGLFNDKPFEIFCGSSEDIYLPQKCSSGTIYKQGNGKYALEVQIRKSDVIYNDVADALMTDEQKALTRVLSLCLRHGVYPQFIVDQMKKSGGDINAFSTAISRVLSKYIVDYVLKDNTCPMCGEPSLEFTEGCIKCMDCNYSQCE